jgi:hypothetical protein
MCRTSICNLKTLQSVHVHLYDQFSRSSVFSFLLKLCQVSFGDLSSFPVISWDKETISSVNSQCTSSHLVPKCQQNSLSKGNWFLKLLLQSLTCCCLVEHVLSSVQAWVQAYVMEQVLSLLQVYHSATNEWKSSSTNPWSWMRSGAGSAPIT